MFFIAYAVNKGPDQAAQMRSLIRAFVARLQIRGYRGIYWLKGKTLIRLRDVQADMGLCCLRMA